MTCIINRILDRKYDEALIKFCLEKNRKLKGRKVYWESDYHTEWYLHLCIDYPKNYRK